MICMTVRIKLPSQETETRAMTNSSKGTREPRKQWSTSIYYIGTSWFARSKTEYYLHDCSLNAQIMQTTQSINTQPASYPC